MRRKAHIVCGLPGSDKTALAKRLEDEYGGVRFCPDEWMAALGIDLFDEVLRDRVEQLQWQFALRLLQLGQVVVIEWGTWGRNERDALREDARARGAALNSASSTHLSTCYGSESKAETWNGTSAVVR